MQRIASPRFVARAQELAALEQLLSRAVSGAGGAMLVTGEAGIGKSRLVTELGVRARTMEMRVLIGECVELAEGELAFAPVISALRGVMDEPGSVDRLDGPLRSALAALWPIAGAGEGSAGGREQLFEAVYRVLARLAEERPVLLIMEDLHWIDPSSRDLLAFLMRNARQDRIALVATYRPDELPRGHPLRPFLSELERAGRAQRIELEPLARSEVAEQLEAIAGRAPSAPLLERIFTRCEGNPFFAEELLASTDTGGGELRGSLRETLLLRVERLSELTREVLRAAAVVGRSVDHRLLASVVGIGESELATALREAADHHALIPSGGGGYVFRHALLREAIYDDTLVGERLRLHRAIAEVLDSHRDYAGAGVAAELAYHWLAAGEIGAALAASLEAANEAARMHALGEAAGHIDRALGLWQRVPAAEEVAACDRVELLLRGSELADFSGDADHGLALAEQARASIDERSEPLRAARAEARIGRSLHFSGRGADAIEHLAEARRLVPKDPPSREYAEALAAEGRALMLNERPREARERLEEAIPIAEQLGAQEVRASALNSLAIVYGEFGELELAVASGREGLLVAEEIGSVEEIMRAYINGNQAIDNAGRIEEALALGIEGIATGDRLGMSRVAGDQLRIQAGWRLLRIGRLTEAALVIEDVLEHATTPFNVAGSQWAAGRLALEQGKLDLAESRLEEAWSLMQRSGGFQLIGPAMAARVLLEIGRGELGRARERAREGLERVESGEGNLLYNAELYWLAVRVEADLAERSRALRESSALNEHEQTATAVLEKLGAAVGKIPGACSPEVLAFQALAEAELTRLRAERSPAPWEIAAGRFREIGANYPAAYAQLRAAEALALAGARPAEIAVALRLAHAMAIEVGSPPFTEQALELARRAGVDLGVPDGANRDVAADLGLTARELEVLRLLADGRTNRQIGDELFITPKTASVHVSRVLVKLGVANRAEAAASAHRIGLAREVGIR